MIAGTYVQTDQIRTAFEDIEQTANRGIDVVDHAAQGDSERHRPGDRSRSTRVARRARRAPCPASHAPRASCARAARSSSTASAIASDFAPGVGHVRTSASRSTPYDPDRRPPPAGPGEVGVDRKLAEDEHLRVGQRVGLATRTGVQPVAIVGHRRLRRRRVDRRRDADRRAAAPTSSAGSTADGERHARRRRRRRRRRAGRSSPPRIRAALPRTTSRSRPARPTRSRAGRRHQRRDRQLPHADAARALRRGAARRRVHHLQHLLDHRRPAHARVRAAARARRDARARSWPPSPARRSSSASPPRCSGCSPASASRAASARCSTPPASASRAAACVLAPRTIVVGARRRHRRDAARRARPGAARDARPARRRAAPATRRAVAPRAGAARRGSPASSSAARRSPCCSRACSAAAPRPPRMGAMAGGARARLRRRRARCARYIVRPLAGARRLAARARCSTRPGRLARENAMRNPARTATTSAALMVGLGLVVFVAVFAAGLKATVDRHRSTGCRPATSSSPARACEPLPAGAGEAHRRRARASAPCTPQYVDQIQVNGEPSDAMTDIVNGVEPRPLRDGLRRSNGCRGGTDALLERLTGTAALVEEQFAKTHGIDVGDDFTVQTPDRRARARSRRSASTATRSSCRGSSSTQRTFRARRPRSRPVRLLRQALRPAPTAAVVAGAVERRAGRVPDRRGAAPTTSTATTIGAQARPDRLPALRAAGDEPRDLAVRDRQQPLPLDPRAHARVRPAARDRRHPRARSGGSSATRA